MPATPHFSRALRIPVRPRNCKRNDPDLPKKLDDVVPACAEPCVSSYINQFWVPTKCSNSTDFACLCTKYSGTGYTLGEIALACVSSSCPQSAPAQVSQVYNVCDQQSSAVTATHTVLTVLVSSTASASPSTTYSTRQTISSISASSSAATLSKTLIVTATTDGNVPIVTNIATPPAAPISSTTSTGSRLTSGQAVGITVGAFGGIGLALALIFCCICIRRRKARKQSTSKHKKRDSLDFACAETPKFPTIRMRHGDTEGASIQSLAGQRSSDRDSYRVTQWLVPGIGGRAKHNRSVSKDSARSDRTVSQLLPDKPDESPQDSRRIAREARPFSAQTAGTVFEEDRTPWSPGLQKPAPIQLNFSTLRTNVKPETSHPILFPAVPQRNSNRNSRNLNLSLHIPKQTPLQRQIADDVDTSKEVAGMPTQTPASANAGQTLSAGSNASYLPSYYTSDQSRTPMIPLRSPSRPFIMQQPWRTAPPQKSLPKAPFPRRQPSRASETSFESVDPNDTTPEFELDTRMMNPNGASPISGLRYPKIPRSANQAVPRSPPTSPLKRTPPNVSAHPLGPSDTIASKRRGPAVANDMQQRLGLADAFQSPPSALKNNRDSFLSYETPARKPLAKTANQVQSIEPSAFVTPPRITNRTGSSDRPRLSVFPNTTPTPPRGMPKRQMNSPAVRGPKLTPTKRGDEFFISVASP